MAVDLGRRPGGLGGLWRGVVVSLLAAMAGCGAHTIASNDARALLGSNPGAFARFVQDAQRYRLQLLVSEVVPGSGGRARLVRSEFRLDAEYFYPASAIKLCAAVAALQEIEELSGANGAPDLLDVPMEIEPLFEGDSLQSLDESNIDGGRITVGQELAKMMLVSDNRAFNRMFDLVGRDRLNTRMWDLGLRSVVINHRLSESRPIPEPGASAAVRFRTADGPAVFVPARTSERRLRNRPQPGLLVGSAYMSGDTRVDQPMDFSARNGASLRDLQDLLIKVVRPDIDLGTPPLRLTEAHRARLCRAMAEYPRESTNPRYGSSEHPDEYCKFLLPGVRRVFPSTTRGERIEILGKIGQAYGFAVENSYLMNPHNDRAVFVAATIYTNADGVLNDDVYEYESDAQPFLADLGEAIARRLLAGP